MPGIKTQGPVQVGSFYFLIQHGEYCNMCQIVNGNRSDVEDFSTLLPPRRIRQKLHRMGNPADILLCPVMGKISLPPDGPDEATSGRRPALSPMLAKGSEEKHSCSVCTGFLDKGLTATSSAPSQYSEITALSVLNVLRRSTQPAHLVVMSAVIILAIMFYPTRKPMNYVAHEIQSESTLWPLLYLSSFSILFGAQMWMTFVSGLVLLFILPRHTFACVQGALFPKYMILNGVTALAVLISFVQTKRVWSSQENYQVIGLIINWLCPLITRIIVVPSLLDRIKTKVILERAAGHGPEAGPKLASFTEATLKECLTYRQTCRRFRQLHAIVAIVNIVTLACNAFHLYYLSSKISFHH